MYFHHYEEIVSHRDDVGLGLLGQRMVLMFTKESSMIQSFGTEIQPDFYWHDSRYIFGHWLLPWYLERDWYCVYVLTFFNIVFKTLTDIFSGYYHSESRCFYFYIVIWISFLKFSLYLTWWLSDFSGSIQRGFPPPCQLHETLQLNNPVHTSAGSGGVLSHWKESQWRVFTWRGKTAERLVNMGVRARWLKYSCDMRQYRFPFEHGLNSLLFYYINSGHKQRINDAVTSKKAKMSTVDEFEENDDHLTELREGMSLLSKG